GRPVFATIANVQSTTADMSWAAVQDVIKYHLMYKIKTSSTWTMVEPTTTSYHATNLTPSSTYQWEVYAICPSGNGQTIVGADFTTQSAAPNVFIPSNAPWKYLDNGSNQGTAWRNLSYTETGWK